MPALMIQGCGSDVGKSVLVAGLCRLLTNRGHRVRPFKPQNMSNNAAVTADGGEIGRSTALQALACRVPPASDMNPVLLKPQSDIGAQLIVQGQRVGVLNAKDHGRDKRQLLRLAVESYRRLASECDWIVVEGAGSPAETNLRTHDIANMGFAHEVDVPVVLVGDINRGHVIASLVGAHAVLDGADRARIRGFIINKFRGDEALFAEGVSTIRSRTGWPSMGIVPWLPAASRLPAEDAVPLEQSPRSAVAGSDRVKIAVLLLPHIANFDDFDPLQQEPAVDLIYIRPGQTLPLDADLMIIPGSKTTIADLAFIRSCGWEHDLHAYVRRGGRLLGICAGYQMLGSAIHDPLCIEGPQQSIAGLGLTGIVTIMEPRKVLRDVSGTELQTGARIQGYEMHLGSCSGAAGRPMVHFDDGTFDGAVSADGRIAGCHVHGLFQSTEYRAALLASLGAQSARNDHSARVHAALDEIAAKLEEVLDVEALIRIGSGGQSSHAPSATNSSISQLKPIR
jgi:adenosylcobyric acid synthase